MNATAATAATATTAPAVHSAATLATHAAIIEASNAQEFRDLSKVRAKFQASSPLHHYLVLNCFLLRVHFTMEKTDYYLFNIFGVVAMLISYFKAFDVRNPTMIVCNQNLEYAFKESAFHVQKLHFYIMKQLIFKEEDYDVLGDVLHNYQIKCIWINDCITNYIPTYNYNIREHTVCRVRNKFLKFLHACHGNAYTTRFTFGEMCATVARYLGPQTERFNFSMQIHKIKDSKLEHIFNVDYCSGRQCLHFIQGQVKEFSNIPTESKIDKAMRKDMEQYHVLKQSIVQAANSISFAHYKSGKVCSVDESFLACSKIIFRKKKLCPMCNDKIDEVIEY